MSQLDILSNRKSAKYSKYETIMRVLWMIGSLLFRFSFRNMFTWRRTLLRFFGASIGKHVHVYNSATIYMPWNLKVGDYSSIGEQVFLYNLGHVSIGERATVSHRVHICAGTHDYKDINLPLLKPPIKIGDQVWICADAFVGPDVRIGNNAIVAARAVVIRDVSECAIVAGNPAVSVGVREYYEL